MLAAELTDIKIERDTLARAVDEKEQLVMRLSESMDQLSKVYYPYKNLTKP